MLWAIVSFIIAVVLSGLGVFISGDPFSDAPSNIFAKVVFWLAVVIFLNAQLLHFIHMVHVRDGA